MTIPPGRRWAPFLALALAAVALAAPALAAPPSAEMLERPAARLRALDKVTARTSTYELAVGESKPFGSLRITVRACRENPPTEPPESAAFLEVVDKKPSEPEENVFSGWMFASSPALSAMDHPIYDIWVLGCAGPEKPAAPASPPAAPAAPAPPVKAPPASQPKKPQ